MWRVDESPLFGVTSFINLILDGSSFASDRLDFASQATEPKWLFFGDQNTWDTAKRCRESAFK